jgi:hypothetical protein
MAATIALPRRSNRIGPGAGVAEAATVSATVPLGRTVHDPLVLAAYLLTGVAGYPPWRSSTHGAPAT